MPLPFIALAMLSTPQNSNGDAATVHGLQAFSRDLMRALPAKPGRNLIASPFSVSQCLAMLLPGVGVSDAALIAKRLHLPADPSVASSGIRMLNSALSQTPNGEVVVANSLWTGPSYHLTATYRDTVARQFGAHASALPDTGAAGVKAVNDWIAAKTKGRIPSLLDHLDRTTSAVLVNAISFDARWQTPFERTATMNRPFHRAGRAESVPTMAARAQMGYGHARGYQVVQLGYASGSYSMLVLLPDAGIDPLSVLRSLKMAKLPAMNGVYVDLQLPKFKFSDRFDLMSSLQALGLASLATHFDARPMLGVSKPMKLSQLLHAAEIEVDENGTRAAAATIGGMRSTAIRREPVPVLFHVDRPFAFVIIHGGTQAPLFVGAVYDPAH
ncbi:MAG: serpin family protein [Fimbriimonadaceae bacterium]